jgi:hypothetical protein
MPGVFAYVGGAIARLLPWLILPGLIVFAGTLTTRRE